MKQRTTIEKLLQRLESRLLNDVKALYARIPDDPVEFCTRFLGFTPTEYQATLLQDQAQFQAARWCRQSGKTHTIAARFLHFHLKHPNTWGGNIGPSFRQTKNVIAKIVAHASKLPRGYVKKAMRTKIEFTNGSKSEAFPNNPDIRGPNMAAGQDSTLAASSQPYGSISGRLEYLSNESTVTVTNSMCR